MSSVTRIIKSNAIWKGPFVAEREIIQHNYLSGFIAIMLNNWFISSFPKYNATVLPLLAGSIIDSPFSAAAYPPETAAPLISST